MAKATEYLDGCLFFTAGALARQMQVMAEDCFMPTGLTPSQGFALMSIVDEPGILPSAIAERIMLAPSTVTRIIDALERKKLVTTEQEGRTNHAYPTAAGEKKREEAAAAWKELYNQYGEIVGQTQADKLCAQIAKTVSKIKGA